MARTVLVVPVAMLTWGLLLLASAQGAALGVPDTPFVQEYREFHELRGTANDVRALAFDGTGTLWAATAEGIHAFKEGKSFKPMQDEDEAGPCFTAVTAPDGLVWIGAWNGLFHTTPEGGLEKIPAILEPIGAVGVTASEVVALGPKGLWRLEGGLWKNHTGGWANSASAAAFDADGTFWTATAHGTYQFKGAAPIRHLYTVEELVTGDQKDVAFAPDGAMWCAGFGGLDVYRQGTRERSYTPAEGLPHSDVRALAFHPDGALWACTALGVARFRDGRWSLRHSLRWLPDDDTRDVAFDGEGTAWVATAKGVSGIHRKMMTLADKAEHYYDILIQRKVRDPWIVGISRLMKQGDVETSVHEDEDNDGEYTNHYLVMEIFRHLATGDPEALERASKAMDTMELFQTVTGTSGMIARTIVPLDWDSPKNKNPHRLHDRNRSYTAREMADLQIRDPRMKFVEERWRRSADGKWLWKGDTSSDEICGHFFGYYFFHEFVAKNDEEKHRIADLSGRVMDYIMEGGYTLHDTDGTPTRWGMWAPDKLLGDGDWRAERAINATELLSFLKVAGHLTGDPKYEQEYRRLIEAYGFLDYARAPKATNPAERTDIDSCLLALVFPALLGIEKDETIRAAYLEGLHQWYGQIQQDHNPFFNFVCGACGVENFNLESSVDFLRDAPLDLVYWTVDNREREDIRLVRHPELYAWQVDRLLPASERYTMRWDKNPYLAVGGSDGYRESTGVYWLLPYWMGRYYGFIQAPPSEDPSSQPSQTTNER